MKTRTFLLPLAIASVLAATACNREETPADPVAAPADPAAPTDTMGTPTDTMATDPAAPPAMDPAMSGSMPPAETTGSDPMTPPTGAASNASTATVTANDANADGGLSMDEVPQGDMLREHFSAADGDGNGMLSQAEIDKHNADMAAKPAQ